MVKRRIGDILVDMGALEPEQLAMALVETRKTGSMLGEVLQRLDWVSEEQLQMAIAVQSGAEILDTRTVTVDATVVAKVPLEFVLTHEILPFATKGSVLLAATANPFDVIARDRLARLTGLQVKTLVAPRDWVKQGIDLHFRTARSLDEDVEELTYGHKSEGSEQRITQLADMLLAKGQLVGASDIHVVPDTRLVRIYYRVDGVLLQTYLFPITLHQSLVTRLKVMADIDISNPNIPHDGRIQYRGTAGKFDLRVSTFPTHLGEVVVMRLLAYNKVVGDLPRLGLEADDLARFMRCIRRPYGLILTTGPTGSGKTTTLFSALMTINSPDINVMTIEDPIEYVIPTVRQTAINPRAGLTFSAALRAAMRQDPDVILVGEIRDQETAELAVRASITGHMVFSTLHTNDSASTVSRLLDMGVSGNLLSSALALVVAQRLLRRVCQSCAEARPLGDAEQREFHKAGVTPPQAHRVHKGCAECGQTGYKGRIGIYEMMEIDKELERLIADGAPRSQLEEARQRSGCESLYHKALRNVAAGLTTFEEVRRVVADA